MAEGISLDPGHNHPVLVAVPAELLQRPDRGAELTALAKGGVVVEPEQPSRGVIHALDVERPRVEDDGVPLQRINGRGVDEAVGVATGQRSEAGVEMLADRRDRKDLQVLGQDAVEAPHQLVQGICVERIDVEVHDLSTRMDAGVGASRDRRLRPNIEMQRNAQRFLEFALHRPQVRLRRPPVEVGAVVAEVDAQSHGPRVGAKQRTPPSRRGSSSLVTSLQLALRQSRRLPRRQPQRY